MSIFYPNKIRALDQYSPNRVRSLLYTAAVCTRRRLGLRMVFVAFLSVVFLLFLFPLLAERVLLRVLASRTLYFLSALFLVYILE